MTKDEKYIARLVFRSKIFESDKQSFEDLFTKVMQHSDTNFKQTKPQGRLGDGKCDGFNQVTGDFYQVYAPEEIEGKEDKANSKMDSSFDGMKTYWTSSGFQVKKCHFVINDKYKNVYASLHTNAQALVTKHGISCEILTCKDIEDIFMKLSEDNMIDILGIIPDPTNIGNVEYDAMNEVIGHLLKSKTPSVTENIPINPDFEKKVEFNSLSRLVGEFLNAGQRQSFVIKEYFELNSKFLKEDLRQIFNDIYRQALTEIPDGENKNDEVFQYIVEKSSPRNNFAYHNAVYVLMAYYFEYCDIFEAPIEV